MARLIMEPATRTHARSLLNDIRREDNEEWVAASGKPTSWTLPWSIDRAGPLARAAVHPDGQTLSIWGANPTDREGVGIAWLISTNRAYEHVVGHHRHFWRGLKEMHAVYPRLEAWAWERNTVHHHWMEHFGFERPGVSAVFAPGFTYHLFTREDRRNVR